MSARALLWAGGVLVVAAVVMGPRPRRPVLPPPQPETIHPEAWDVLADARRITTEAAAS